MAVARYHWDGVFCNYQVEQEPIPRTTAVQRQVGMVHRRSTACIIPHSAGEPMRSQTVTHLASSGFHSLGYQALGDTSGARSASQSLRPCRKPSIRLMSRIPRIMGQLNARPGRAKLQRHYRNHDLPI